MQECLAPLLSKEGLGVVVSRMSVLLLSALADKTAKKRYLVAWKT
jgi:hypothetical protein